MIADLERRLAEVLGQRLPAPFQGHVQVAPGTAAAADAPALRIGAAEIEPLEPDFGDTRAEVVTGAPDPRRVLRLACTLGLEVRPAAGAARAQQLEGLDAAMYLLDSPDFRDGSALAGDPDPGFLLEELRLVAGTAPLDPSAAGAPPVGLTLAARGLFWPVGVAGEAGRAIAEVRLRGVALPLLLEPDPPRPLAGGPPLTLTLRLGTRGPLRLQAPGAAPLPAMEFGALALALRGRGGQPGAGTLAGGTAGAGGTLLVPLSHEEAEVQYTPPADPAHDLLIVALDEGGGPGLELARVPLEVR